jgi:colanic acid biosynthesis protein WcaH
MAFAWWKVHRSFAGIQGRVMRIIPEKDYAQIMEVLPILCVDIVVQNSKNEYLLIQRANEPLQDQWWVIGGRVHKGETLEQAAIRKVKEEVGLIIRNVSPIGYYEDVSEINPFGLQFPQHSVSVVFSAMIEGDQCVILDYQSKNWKFSENLPDKFFVARLIEIG